MVELLFLLLPLAFYSGWRAAKKSLQRKNQKQNQLSDSFVKGVNYLLSEEPDKALEVFLNYPDIDEYTAETFQLLGNLFRERGEVDRALRVHQNVIARTNLNAKQKQKAMYALGKDFFAAGMLDRAESVFQELLDSNNHKWISKSAICNSLRTIYEQTQDWHKAIEATQCISKFAKKNDNALDSNGTNNDSLISHYYCELADQALSEGNLHAADQYISNARKFYKKSPRLMTLQGDIAYHQKNYQDVYQFYLKAIRQDARLLSMLFEKLEESASATGDIDSLQKVLAKQYKNNADKNIFEAILRIAEKHGVSEDIAELLESSLKNNKLNVGSIYKASQFMLQKNQSAEALTNLELLDQSLANYLQGLPVFRCEHCGYKMHDFLWRCPACHHWDSIDQV